MLVALHQFEGDVEGVKTLYMSEHLLLVAGLRTLSEMWVMTFSDPVK